MISISEDKHGKVFDVVNFDMINILAFDFTPEVAAWVHQPGDAIQVQFIFFSKTHDHKGITHIKYSLAKTRIEYNLSIFN